MYKNKNKGFTLVELIIVIVVLGILAAIGIPRYNDYVNDGRLAHIKADMNTISSLIEVTAMEDDGVFRDSSFDDLSELEKAITEGRAYKEGNPLLSETDIGGDLHTIKAPFIKNSARSKLKGTFLVDNNDEVYYIANKKLKGTSDTGNEPDEPGIPDGVWRYTSIEPGIIGDYLITATDGINKKYLIVDYLTLQDQLKSDFVGHAMYNRYEGWKELPHIDEFPDSELFDKKPILYSKNIYDIDGDTYTTLYNGTEYKHKNHRVISLINSGIYLESNNIIYYFNLYTGNMSEVESIDEETLSIVQNMGDIADVLDYVFLANKKIYSINSRNYQFFSLSEVENSTGHNVISFNDRLGFLKLDNGNYVDIDGEKLVEVNDPRQLQEIENDKDDSELISDLSMGHGIDLDLELNKVTYTINPFPIGVDPTRVKLYRKNPGIHSIIIIENGKIWLTGYHIHY